METQSSVEREAQEIRVSPEFKRWIEYDYGTHEAAAQHFRSAGLSQIDVVPRYEAPYVREKIQALMDRHAPGVKVFDLTPKVPTTASGNLLECIRVMIRCREAVAANPNILWYIQRTRENSPAFVHMFAYGQQVQQLNQPGAPLSDASYCGLAFFRGTEITLPARLAVGSGDLAAEIIVSHAGVNYHGFKCVACLKPFVKWTVVDGRNVKGIDALLITDCDHTIHPDCVLERIATHSEDCGKCPACNTQLPWTTIVNRPVSNPSAEPVVDRAGRPGMYIGDASQHTEAQLAANRAAIADSYMASLRATYNRDAFERAGVGSSLIGLDPVLSDAPFA